MLGENPGEASTVSYCRGDYFVQKLVFKYKWFFSLPFDYVQNYARWMTDTIVVEVFWANQEVQCYMASICIKGRRLTRATLIMLFVNYSLRPSYLLTFVLHRYQHSTRPVLRCCEDFPRLLRCLDIEERHLGIAI